MKPVLLGLFCLLISDLCGQFKTDCDSIIIYNAEFDKLFQDEYQTIKADTVLAIRHCYNSNGCSYTFGVLCWKLNDQFYFKKIQRKKGKIKSTIKLDKELRQKLVEFYRKKIFEISGEIEEKDQFWFDDGPVTLLLFKTTENCWRFSLTASVSKDLRIVWTKELISSIKN